MNREMAVEERMKRAQTSILSAGFGEREAHLITDGEFSPKAYTVNMPALNQLAERVSQGANLILVGESGTGKTSMAAWLCYRFTEETRKRPDYMATPYLLMTVNANRFNEQRLVEITNSVTKTHLLILDEFGSTTPTAFDLNYLQQIIDTRYANLLPTMVISNLTLEELNELYGKKTMTRLRQGGAYISLAGKNLREINDD